jgi:hypothetical protein
MIFDGTPPGSAEPADLRGGIRSGRRYIGWHTFFRFPGFEADVRPNKRIDTRLSTPLFDLPLGAIPGGAPPASLAQRNLLRHLTWRVPSGQAIAQAMAMPMLTDCDLAELAAIDPSFVRSTPLWYYVLEEADVFEMGNHLAGAEARRPPTPVPFAAGQSCSTGRRRCFRGAMPRGEAATRALFRAIVWPSHTSGLSIPGTRKDRRLSCRARSSMRPRRRPSPLARRTGTTCGRP